MKQSLCDVCLAAAMLLAIPASGWPSGWPVTNTVYHWEVYDGKHDLRTVVSVGLMRTPRDYRLPRTEDLLLSYAKEHGIPVSNMVSVAQTVAEEGFSMLESGSITNKKETAAVMRYCGTLIEFMGYTRDLSALPYLELKSASVNDDIRRTAANMIVNILGSNAIGFIRKVTRNKLYKRDLYSLYESFGYKIRMEKKNNPKAKVDDAYAFLLELVVEEESGGTVKMLDRVLCETLDGYSTSVQREGVAERMVETGPDYSRPHFEAIKAEVEKTPKAKRKDFTARGELLDPDRKSEKRAP